MYSDSSLHDASGKWQMIFGVETHPKYRHMGYAYHLLKQVIEDVRKQNRKGIVLTCKESMIQYYKRFGFVNKGIAQSTHGGEIWYQMKLKS